MRRTHRPRAALASAAATVALLTGAASALGATGVTSTTGSISVAGDASDPTTLTISAVETQADGDHVFRIGPVGSVSGPACTADGADAVCNDNASAGARSLTVTTGSSDDVVTNTSPVGATYHLGAGDDVLHLAPTRAVANTIDGGLGSDFFDIGRSLGPDTVRSTATDPADVDLADYAARTPDMLGGHVTVDARGLSGPNDGGPGEHDDITAQAVRGTPQSGDDITAPIADGSLGADSFHGSFQNIEVVDYEYPVPYDIPAADRTGGVTVDAVSGTNSDGDSLAGIRNIRGTSLADDITTSSGTADGRGGPDTLRGGFRDAVLIGGTGDDTFDAGAGDDAGNPNRALYDGGAGSDTLTYEHLQTGITATLGPPGTTTPAEANSQGDRVLAMENLIGSPQADDLTGNGGPNVIRGLAGNDRLADGRDSAAADADTLDGGAGTDTADYRHDPAPSAQPFVIDLGGGSGEDALSGIEIAHGSPGNDRLIGTEGSDQLFGDDGDDVLQGLAGADVLVGERGVDTVSYEERTSGLTIDAGGAHPDGDLTDLFERTCGTQGNDTLIAAGDDALIGLGGNDVLRGGAGDNTLIGDGDSTCAASGFGNDRMLGGAGADTFDGGPGTDTASYSDHAGPVQVHLQQSVTGNFANTDGDVINTATENLEGSTRDDVLVGNGADNVITGLAGNDVIAGENGDDVLNGNGGDDRIGPFLFTRTATGQAVAQLNQAPSADGRDRIIGGPGEDELDTRDTTPDEPVSCGTETDTARIDLKDPATALDCENQLRAPVDMLGLPVVGGKWKVSSGSSLARAAGATTARSARPHWKARLLIRCGRDRNRFVPRRCGATVRILTRRGGRALGSRRFSIAQGHAAWVTLRLSRRPPARAVSLIHQRVLDGRFRESTQVRR